MRFKAMKTDLQPKLNAAKRIISKKTNMPALSVVLIEAGEVDYITVTATDLELTYITKIPAKVEQFGAVCVGLKSLLNILSTLGEKLQFNSDENSFQIIHATGQCQLPTFNLIEYPMIEPLIDKYSIIVPGDVWKTTTNKVLIAAAKPSIRPNYAGVLVEITPDELTMVATDTYRLALDKLINESNKPWPENRIFIPAKLLTEVNKNLKTKDTLTIQWNEKRIKFNTPQFTLIGQLLDTAFPQYRNVIPKPVDKPLYLDRITFRNILKQIVQSQKRKAEDPVVELKTNECTLKVLSKNSDELIYNEITLQQPTENINIRLNAKFLFDPLMLKGSKTIRLDITNWNKPCVYRDNDYLYLVCPILN